MFSPPPDLLFLSGCPDILSFVMLTPRKILTHRYFRNGTELTPQGIDIVSLEMKVSHREVIETAKEIGLGLSIDEGLFYRKYARKYESHFVYEDYNAPNDTDLSRTIRRILA